MIIWDLCKAMRNAKTLSQKRKVELWKYSVWLVTCVTLVALFILIFSFWIDAYVIGDLLSDITVIVAIAVHFWQWRENVRVYIDRRFMTPLRSSRLVKEKHVFSTRVESLANSVIKNCNDTDTAVQIVKEARNIEKQIFDECIEMKKP